MRLRFGGGSDLVGQGECVVEIWWWLRFCDGGGRGRWMGFVIWKRKARGDLVEQWLERWVQRESNKAEKWVERERERV